MALTDPTQIRTTNLDSETTDYVAGEEPWNKNLDGYVIPSKETDVVTYQADFDRWHGMYRKIPELRSTIDTQARWIIGKKIEAQDKKTSDAMKRIKGKGKETFRKICINMERTAEICGDSYAWAPRDKAGRLINLKILDSGSIEIQADKFGVIQKYVQLENRGQASLLSQNSKRKVIEEFNADEIFHISNDPIADEIHGIPEPEKMQDIIKMRHQSMNDTTVTFHRYGKPTYFFEADTDDDTELQDVTDTLNKAIKNFENVVVPKGTLSKIDRVATPQYSTLDPLPWMAFLRSYFTESSGVPDLVRGKSDEVSLAAGKLNLVSYKEKIRFKQIDWEEAVEQQLGLKIKLEEPIMIDIEIARTEQDMNLKESAKRQRGGDTQIVSPNNRTSEKR